MREISHNPCRGKICDKINMYDRGGNNAYTYTAIREGKKVVGSMGEISEATKIKKTKISSGLQSYNVYNNDGWSITRKQK